MSCNAWNHHPSCNCGWGGDTGGGGWSYFVRPAPIVSRFTTARPTVRLSVTIPNARCPVCGADVYFYESPYGGRVFFDELGPPWTKHPCTDNPSPPRARPARSPVNKPPPQWHRDGWLNLQHVSIARRDSRTIIEGNDLVDQGRYVFAVSEPVRCEPDDPIFVRRNEQGDGSWEIQYFPANSSLIQPAPESVVGFPNATSLDQIKQWERLSDGDGEAHNFVGMSLSFARGLKADDGTWTFAKEPDWAAAELHFLLAASEGYWAGFHNLGAMYRHGLGVRHDPELSMKYTLSACLFAGDECEASIQALTAIYALGWGAPEDLELAKEIIALLSP